MFLGDDASRILTELDTVEFVQPEMLGGAAAAALLQSPEFAGLIENQGDRLIDSIAIRPAH